MKRENILDQEIKNIAQKERELLSELLPKIRELDSSKGYLDLGFPSLFEYLTKSVGYSEGSAQRRIDASRLSRDIPALGEKLEAVAIKLNQLSLVKKAIRQVSKTRKVQKEETQNLVSQLEGKNHRESEKAVAEFFNLAVQEAAKTKVQANESVRIELTVSKELYAKIKIAQEELSHIVPSGNLVDYLEYVTNKVLEKKPAPGKSTATVAVTPKLRREVLSEEPTCQHKDPGTGKICGSRWQLQVDHKHPKWAGGGSERANLQTLCAQHNRWKYRRETGTRVEEMQTKYS